VSRYAALRAAAPTTKVGRSDMTRKPMARKLVLAAAVVFVLSAKPTWAQPPVQNQCMSQLAACYYWAAAQAGFWVMWASGIDCELAMVDCIRRSIIGR
jgi:hypothetical protein